MIIFKVKPERFKKTKESIEYFEKLILFLEKYKNYLKVSKHEEKKIKEIFF